MSAVIEQPVTNAINVLQAYIYCKNRYIFKAIYNLTCSQIQHTDACFHI